MRSIQPQHIRVSEDLKFAMFTDLRRVRESYTETDDFDVCKPPYSALNTPQFMGLASTCVERDLWSIGAILLEILVGSRIVLTKDNVTNMRILLGHC